MDSNNNNKEIILGSLISLIFISYFVMFYYPNLISKEKVVDEKELITIIVDPFEKIDLEATAVLVWDMTEQETLYSYNPEIQLPMASLTKLMTSLVANELVPKGSIIVIDSDDISKEGDQGLLVGERWSLNDIIDFTLVTSSNDGARSLASVVNFGNALSQDQEEKLFVGEMNQKAKELGLSQTFFLNESGLDTTKSISGSYSSVKDISLLMEHILTKQPDLLDATAYEKLLINSYNTSHLVTNTNKIIGHIPGAVASKTGFTDLAGGNLVVVFDAGINHPIIITVLGSSIDGRFEDMKKLIQASILKINS
jgi:D-alanyl-D-alanine carboxypeptidase